MTEAICPYCRQPSTDSAGHEPCAEAFSRGYDPTSPEDAQNFLAEQLERLAASLTERMFPGAGR